MGLLNTRCSTAWAWWPGRVSGPVGSSGVTCASPCWGLIICAVLKSRGLIAQCLHSYAGSYGNFWIPDCHTWAMRSLEISLNAPVWEDITLICHSLQLSLTLDPWGLEKAMASPTRVTLCILSPLTYSKALCYSPVVFKLFLCAPFKSSKNLWPPFQVDVRCFPSELNSCNGGNFWHIVNIDILEWDLF